MAVAALGTVATMAGDNMNVGITALVGMKGFPLTFLDFECLLQLLFNSILLLFVGVVFFVNRDRLLGLMAFGWGEGIGDSPSLFHVSFHLS